jgi:hypothetical protein
VRLTEVVQQAAAEQYLVAQRIERPRDPDVVVDRVVLGGGGQEVADLLRPLGPELRADVDDDEAGERRRVVAGVLDRGQAAERHPDEHVVRQPEVTDERLDVGGMRLQPVVQRRRPLAVAVPA